MGSLMRDQRWVVMEKSAPLSPLTPFHQRQNNRSPLESPPIAKKLPKFKDADLFFGHMFVGCPPTPSSSSASPVLGGDGKENRSILKPRGNRPSRSGRRVDFDQDVVVYHFDKAEGSHVGCESQRLNSDTKNRKEFVNRTLQGKSRPPVATDSTSPKTFFGRREPPILYAEPLPVTSSPSAQYPVTSFPGTNPHYAEPLRVTSRYDGVQRLQVNQPNPAISTVTLDHKNPSAAVQGPPPTEDEGHVPTADDVDFSFFEDEHHSLRLKFTVPLGEGVAASDVLVKANTNGNKVRLVGTRTIGTSRHGTIIRQEFTERYQLPMDVDPYMITARMDNSGNLYVEAPVMTPDRKRALAAERQTMNETRIGSISDFVL